MCISQRCLPIQKNCEENLSAANMQSDSEHFHCAQPHLSIEVKLCNLAPRAATERLVTFMARKDLVTEGILVWFCTLSWVEICDTNNSWAQLQSCNCPKLSLRKARQETCDATQSLGPQWHTLNDCVPQPHCDGQKTAAWQNTKFRTNALKPDKSQQLKDCQLHCQHCNLLLWGAEKIIAQITPWESLTETTVARVVTWWCSFQNLKLYEDHLLSETSQSWYLVARKMQPFTMGQTVPSSLPHKENMHYKRAAILTPH